MPFFYPQLKYVLVLIAVFFSFFQRSRIQVWLYEQVNMRIEGCIIVGFGFSSFYVKFWSKPA